MKYRESAEAIAELSKIAASLTGNQLNERHWEMIRSRLQRRLFELKLDSHSEYLDYFHAHRDEETPKLIALLTTHHTYFFREFSHFEFLQSTAIPALLPELRARPDQTLRVWSAACSRGHEVYSLAMFLDMYLTRPNPDIKFEILGTDLDAESVAIAKNGVYLRSELKDAPLSLLGNHFARGTGEIEAYVKAKSSLSSHCKFLPLNLLKLKGAPEITGKFDLIFCRNVFIYFNAEQITSISKELLSRLSPTGYFFVGVSESLTQLNLPVCSASPSIYRIKAAEKPMAETKNPARPVLSPVPTPVIATPVPKPMRILCVDDSPSILTLLKQILSKSEGFEIIGTAVNGEEAAKKVTELRPDALTLDIHMPVMTGIEYLKKHFRTGHPPVVMVTSVSRDDAALAGQALDSGAADFVEKPALSNLAERGDEIRTKLRCAVSARNLSSGTNRSLDRSFETRKHITEPETKLRIVVATIAHRSKLKSFFAELSGPQPPCVLLIDGAREALPKVAEVLSREIGKSILYSDTLPKQLDPGAYYLADLGSQAKSLSDTWVKQRRTSILVFGDVAKGSAEKILQFGEAQLLLEDLGNGKGAAALSEAADDIVPTTSFSYLSEEYFTGADMAVTRKAA